MPAIINYQLKQQRKKKEDHRKDEEFSSSKLTNHLHLRKKLITPTERNHNEL